MADIIEEIGDLVGEEDKGDIRTATRTVDLTQTGEDQAADNEGLNSETYDVTVKDLVSVEEVVAVNLSTDGETYQQVVSTDSTGDVVGANGSPASDNVVTVSFKIADSAGVGPAGDGDVLGDISQLRVVARGY